MVKVLTSKVKCALILGHRIGMIRLVMNTYWGFVVGRSTLNQQILERVEEKFSKIQCERDLIKWICDIERDRHILRTRLGNTMVQNGRNLSAISRSMLR